MEATGNSRSSFFSFCWLKDKVVNYTVAQHRPLCASIGPNNWLEEHSYYSNCNLGLRPFLLLIQFDIVCCYPVKLCRSVNSCR